MHEIIRTTVVVNNQYTPLYHVPIFQGMYFSIEFLNNSSLPTKSIRFDFLTKLLLWSSTQTLQMPRDILYMRTLN